MTTTDQDRAPVHSLWSQAVLAALLLAATVLAGCGKSTPGSSQTLAAEVGPAGPEVVKVEQAFAAAQLGVKFAVADALRPVKAGSYADALPELRKLAANPNLDTNQKQSLQDLLRKLETLPGSNAAR